MQLLRDRYPTMEDALRELEFLSQNDVLREEYNRRLMAKLDHNTQMNERYEKGLLSGLERGLEQGHEKGLETGFEKGKLEDAAKMAEKGLSPDLILEITGLDQKALQEAGIIGSKN